MRIRRLIPTLLLSTAAVLPAAAGQYDMCITAADSVNCIIEQAEFAHQRNAEIDASIANVARTRAFEHARNAEIAASIAAVNATRTRQLEIEQNALANRVLAVANAERNRRFAAYQNELATDSVERVAALRKWQLAMSTTHCKSPRSRTPRCAAERAQKFAKRQNALATASIERVKAERARQFAAARNAEIEASIAAVARNRGSILAINTTHCTGIEITPRCEAERNRELTLALSHCKSATDTSPRCAVERDRNFHIARNAEIERSLAAVARNRAASSDYSRIETSGICKPYNCSMDPTEYAALTSHCVRRPESPRCAAERIREFAAARNAEIERSLAAVARNRAATLALDTTHCKGPQVTPRCENERNREFAAARNAEINASIAAVKRARASERQQAATLSAAEYAALTSHCVRSPQSPRCTAERIREFAAARNREINHSIAAVAGARALERMQAAGKLPNGRKNALNAALSAYGSIESPLETGAIGNPELPIEPGPTPAQDLKLQHESANEPCRPAGRPFAPLPFTKGISIDESMVPELERLAGIASVCPGVRIEVHGYSDGKGSLSTNRANAQAGAQAVTDYLIAAGIAPNRIAAIGRGGIHSVLPYSKGDRQRRVEFVVRDPGMDAVARRVMWDLAELLDPTYIPAVAGLSP
jgi:outer membrane protein OmpA-like peptidoglycan-associated protein